MYLHYVCNHEKARPGEQHAPRRLILRRDDEERQREKIAAQKEETKEKRQVHDAAADFRRMQVAT